ncbi:MAG: hypothetical protein LBU32_22235 [Clostridiales bacterium]|jgi:hypothetical protein|nr:hypothetical protein [Clostridiales bacterium]
MADKKSALQEESINFLWSGTNFTINSYPWQSWIISLALLIPPYKLANREALSCKERLRASHLLSVDFECILIILSFGKYRLFGRIIASAVIRQKICTYGANQYALDLKAEGRL